MGLLLVSVCEVSAASQSFDFEDEKGINHVLVILDAPLEFISGKGEGVSGFVSYDPAAPEATTGSIILTVDSIELNNYQMSQNMMGKRWLNAKAHPEITFELESFKVKKREGSLVSGTAHGDFTFLGTTRSIEVPVSFNYFKDAANQRAGRKQAGDERDLLVLRSAFTVLLDEYGLDLAKPLRLKVANEVQVKVNIVGYTAE
jgi:polyisoprenoid-binding protein YceI